jgi:hypothetical protein
MKLTDKLGRLRALRAAVHSARRVTAEGAEEARGRESCGDALERLVGAVRQRNHYGEFLLVRRWFDAPEACAASRTALQLLAPDAPAAAADPANWLFLDTETTGLAGGTGTYAFLVGVAWWDAAGFQVEQYFMRDHSEEHSLLLALAERLAERPVLLTFNGKSFDWPLLETRFRMTRAIPPPALPAHLDLLHPARHLWRLRLGSVRLSELERHVLGFDRGFDIRSEIIPQIYFDYLRGGPVLPLADVFRHNQMDLRGLAALARRVVALLSAPETTAGDPLEYYGLSRMLHRRGEMHRARQFYELALGAGLPAAVDRAARRELALLAKRDRDFARATALWEELVDLPVRAQQAAPLQPQITVGATDEGLGAALEAYEQLAIYYEHHARDPLRAAEMTRAALTELRRAFRAATLEPGRYRKLKAQLDHRLARLERKVGASLMPPRAPMTSP